MLPEVNTVARSVSRYWKRIFWKIKKNEYWFAPNTSL